MIIFISRNMSITIITLNDRSMMKIYFERKYFVEIIFYIIIKILFIYLFSFVNKISLIITIDYTPSEKLNSKGGELSL